MRFPFSHAASPPRPDIYQARAAAAGMSMQEYMLAELVHTAELRTPAEIVIEVERRLVSGGDQGFSALSSAEVIAADRTSH